MRFPGFSFRPKRATRRVMRAFADAQDLPSTLATGRCIAGWAYTKILGKCGRTREVTLRLRHHLNLSVDASRSELISYWEIWHEGIYERVPGFCSFEPECVIDVGANIGAFTLYQTLKKKAKLVIAFEPSPTVFRRLAANLSGLNGPQNAQMINAVVGESCGTVPFLENPMSVNCRVARGGEAGAFMVPCVTLDSSLMPFRIPRVDLLKIDTEGYETQVLKGAEQTLQKTDRLIIEIHKEADKKEFDAWLFARSFRFIIREGDVLYYSR